MASFEERIYELGTQALAEQERQVAEVRSRGATLIAAGAVIASLLAKATFQGDHPAGAAELVAALAGITGASGVLLFVVLLIGPYQLGFSVKPGATYRTLWNENIVEQPMIDLALAEAFEERRETQRERRRPPHTPSRTGARIPRRRNHRLCGCGRASLLMRIRFRQAVGRKCQLPPLRGA